MAPITIISFDAALNKSIPMVSYLFIFLAIIVFVPTPSMLWTMTGLSYSFNIGFKSYSEPKLPIPVSTLAENVDFILDLISSTALFPASISTPADL